MKVQSTLLARVLRGREARRRGSRSARLRRASAAWLVCGLLAGSALAADQPARVAERSPQLSIGDVAVGYRRSARARAGIAAAPSVRVPVRFSRIGSANFIRLSLNYDDANLVYRGVIVRHADWSVSEVTGFREVNEGHLEGAFLRDAPDGPVPLGTAEETLLEVVFALRDRLEDSPNLLSVDTRVSFHPLSPDGPPAGSVESWVAHLSGSERYTAPRPLPTVLRDGTVSIYYQNFAEVGSGRMTRRPQTFLLPLSVSIVSTDVAVISVGIDYDELILREVVPATPPVVAGPIAITHRDGSGEFELELGERTAAGRLLGRHVADLVFEYQGESPPGASALHIIPRLRNLEESPEAGEGASGSRSVAGVIRFAPARFVRGNVASRTDAEGGARAPAMKDALDVIQSLFLDSSRKIPCLEAADVDDSGEVELADAIWLLNYLYHAGPPPAAPFPRAGTAGWGGFSDLGCDQPLPFFEPRPSER